MRQLRESVRHLRLIGLNSGRLSITLQSGWCCGLYPTSLNKPINSVGLHHNTSYCRPKAAISTWMGLPLWFTNPEGSKIYYQGWVITHRLLCHSDDFIIISKHDCTSCFIFYGHKKKEKGVFLSPTLLTSPTVVVGALLQYFTGESLKEILQNLLASSVHRMLFLYVLAQKKRCWTESSRFSQT